uniref:Reverse transcriptase domain-containing protein n=1 Tax=Physcomitrium patens TaxID=3218 RepID=A0A7I4EX43_PHYPA
FLPFSLKNALIKFQQVMDKVLSSLSFFRCYINDVIIFSNIP